MGVQQPYMYDSDRRDSRLPEKPFDPKAITRASWTPQPKKKKKQNGPLLGFGRHPDAQAVPTGRTLFFRPMSSTTKGWIKSMRYVQLFLRVLEMIGGGGLLTLMILIGNVDPLTAWVMRITPGVVAISCVYAIWHFIRPVNARPPASSAAYQLFAGVMDLAVVPLYAFGAISVNNHGTEWKLIITASSQLTEILVQSEYYLLISAGGLHVVSLGISIYLGLMFRRIAIMPPDMNPLESHLTSRANQHKRNKSSVATSYTAVSDDTSSKRFSGLESHRNSGATFEDLSRPPSIPFMHTRTGSRDSFASSKRDSRADLPSRQYQITPGNSPRNSVADMKRMSNGSGLTISTSRTAQRGNYTEVPLHETGVSTPTSSRPSSGVTLAPMPSPSAQQPINASPTRVAKFTEAWYASESLINRTQERQRAMNAAERRRERESRQYEAVNQRYTFDEDDSSDDRDSDRENNYDVIGPDYSDIEDDGAPSSPINVTAHLHPNPLRLNPIPATPPKDAIAGRQKTPFQRDGESEALSDVNLNDRRVSGSRDIADQQPSSTSGVTSFWRRSTIGKSKPNLSPRNRNSSIQPDGDFYAKPYGELKSATPPIMMGTGGNVSGGGGRQVSSGNDYGDLGSAGMGVAQSYRRNVSGKVAEEGLAGKRYSRYSILNED
ncbi:uncharacterized protein GGS22DRAFT_152508 [Annulohypoxylon maeteangense]|uniref:uncharacterized protein n=1 Tax=Annulohypoxylon maeteangense TaxID=1927788 RepID=UPI002007A601|nr:uncharacterized protein GGS22DRAFT_152508 [Annulohypoxylon maeteangense]KAI0888844.1 hypothetical protein GGS22DRAFT_152508 [Annulohypoxylon maeteangense]